MQLRGAKKVTVGLLFAKTNLEICCQNWNNSASKSAGVQHFRVWLQIRMASVV